MNAIKSKEQQNHSSALKFLPTATTINSRRRHTYLGTTIATSEVDVNNWKQNAAQSQVYKLIFFFIFYFYMNLILEKNS
jgi:hypothetical protein